MCAQCMMGAATAAAGATGVRAWLATRRPSWLSAILLRRISAGLIVSGVLLAGVISSSHQPASPRSPAPLQGDPR